jgi:hypothetical protein
MKFMKCIALSCAIALIILAGACTKSPESPFTGDWAFMSTVNKYGGRMTITGPENNKFKVLLSGYTTPQEGTLNGEKIEMTVKEKKFTIAMEAGNVIVQSETDKFIGEKLLVLDSSDKWSGKWAMDDPNNKSGVVMMKTDKGNYILVPDQSSMIYLCAPKGDNLEMNTGTILFELSVKDGILSAVSPDKTFTYKKQ